MRLEILNIIILLEMYLTNCDYLSNDLTTISYNRDSDVLESPNEQNSGNKILQNVKTNQHEVSLETIKSMLEVILDKINQLQNIENTAHQVPDPISISKRSSPTTLYPLNIETKNTASIEHRIRKRQKWDQWTDWSTCSVSCGKGRKIRWRHCLDGCDEAETEMEEKACQLPACSGKLFGVIKL